MSVYKYLEAFAKLEKRLMDGQEGSAAMRGQPSIHDVRNKLDKFIKVLGPREIQVRRFHFTAVSAVMQISLTAISATEITGFSYLSKVFFPPIIKIHPFFIIVPPDCSVAKCVDRV